MISFSDFQRMNIRIGKIEVAERIEGSSKLIKLQMDFGSEKRQLVAGIAEEYSPEDLVGKEIPVLANLEPKTFMGVESQGMILAADVDDRPVLLHPDKDIPAGSKVR
jgi:methionine--tRNA ligase beta chain